MSTADDADFKVGPEKGPWSPGGGTPPYEFSTTHNATIGELAAKMRFVGGFLIVGGVLHCLNVLAGNLGALIMGLVFIALGVLTRRSAAAFQLIVDTPSDDIRNLMAALEALLKMYRIQYILLVVGLILLALVALVAIFQVVAR